MPVNAPAPVVPTPPCEPCRTLLEALCQIGPQDQGWCDVRAAVMSGRRDSTETMRWIFEAADPTLLLQARDWVQDHE